MSTNEITGDKIITDAPSEKFSNGWDAIWGKKEKKEVPQPEHVSKEDFQNDIIRRAQNIKVELKPKYAPELTESFIRQFIPSKA